MLIQSKITQQWKRAHVYEGSMGNAAFAPSSIAILPSGEVWVTDEINHRVCRYTAQLTEQGTFGKRGKGPGEFRYPVGLHVSTDGVYVVDKWNHRIQLFSYEGEFIRAFGHYGDGVLQFNEPCALALCDDRIYVADKSNGRVEMIRNGQRENSYENHDPLPQFYSSTSFQNSLYYKNWTAGCSRYNSMITQFRNDGFKVGLLEYPEVIVCSQENAVFVVDRVNHQIVEFTEELMYVKTHSIADAAITTVCNDSVRECVWFASEDDGRLWCKRGEELQVVDLGDLRVSAMAIHGVDCYITDFWNGQIYHFVEGGA